MRTDNSQSASLSVPILNTSLRQLLNTIVQTVLLGLLLVGVFVQLLNPEAGLWLILASLFIGTALIVCLGINSRKEIITMVLCLGVALSACNYLIWRTGVINWFGWWMAVPLFTAEAFGIIHTLGFQYTLWPRPEPEIRPVVDPTQQSIFVFIPTVNEGTAVLRKTLHGVLQARTRYLNRYPHGQIHIVLCNDGRVAGVPNWQSVEQLAERLGVICISREIGGGAKAGNIEHARQQLGATGNALVAIFDADQVAEPDFFVKSIPPFADPTIAWVQTGQYYGNRDNIIANWSNDQQALFYQVLCPGKAAQNAAFICGTNVVLRAAALDQIGGLPQDSVTEDFAASIQLHRTWRSVFLTDVLAIGLGPMTLKSYFKQQKRWAIGTLSVLRAHWQDIFLPKRHGLSLAQRIQYALACTHYLSGLRDAIYVAVPLLFLVTGIAAVRGADLSTFAVHFVPYWLLSQIAFWNAGWRKTTLRGVIIGFGSFPVLLTSIATVIAAKRVAFSVTAKHRTADSVWNALTPHIVSFILCVLGLIVFSRTAINQEPLVITALWVVYTMCMLAGMLWLGVVETYSQQKTPRLDRFVVWFSACRRFASRQLNNRLTVPLGGGMVVATLFTLVVAVGGHNSPGSRPNPFSVANDRERPYFGVSLPTTMLSTATSQLDSKLQMPVRIVGRTQDISDNFDSQWANSLAANGVRLWLTLLFNVPNTPAYNASLPAIANGIHDTALRRWADDIRDFGKPVYVTVLPQADRNWVLSSGVTNNGIPQDAPRAWEHVQAIFSQEGAVNVAWVWSPADPAHDALYDVPSQAIDVVALTLISYPGTDWANPGESLAALRLRYPSKPVFLQIAAQGDPEQKAAWLNAVGTAIAGTSDIYGLIYYDGDPSPTATPAQNISWAFDSDPLSLAAMNQSLELVHSRVSTSK